MMLSQHLKLGTNDQVIRRILERKQRLSLVNLTERWKRQNIKDFEELRRRIEDVIESSGEQRLLEDVSMVSELRFFSQTFFVSASNSFMDLRFPRVEISRWRIVWMSRIKLSFSIQNVRSVSRFHIEISTKDVRNVFGIGLHNLKSQSTMNHHRRRTPKRTRHMVRRYDRLLPRLLTLQRSHQKRIDSPLGHFPRICLLLDSSQGEEFHRNESLYLVAAGSEISIWKVEQIPRLSVGNLTWHTSLRVHIHGAGKHEPEEPTEDNFSVNFVDISSDGRFFSVSITDSRFVFVWDILSDHHMPVELAHTSPVISMDWHLNTRDPYAGSLPSVLKTHCSDGHIFFWKQSPILDHHAHAHHPLESTSQTLSRTRNPSASILSKLSDLGSSGDLKKFEFNASATQDGEELKSGMSTPTQFHAHFSMFCALEIDMSSTPVQMKDSESGKTTSVKCKFVSSSWIENLGVRPYATDTLSKMHLVTAEAKKVHKPSDVTTTPARSTVKWTRPNLKKKKSIAIISAMKPAVSNSPVPLVKHSHFQLQFHKLRHRDIGKKMKKTMSSRPSRDPFTTDTEDVSSVDGEQSRMSLFGRAVDEELDSALAEARKKTISSEDMLDPIEDDKSDSEDSLDFHPIFEQRNRLFFENDQVNRKSTTRDGDCKAWIAVLSSNRSLAIFCIENLFRDHPGASRVFQFTCLPDFVNHSVLQESPISLFSSSLFTTNFMWERPPAKDFDRAIFANKGFAPAPNSLNVYYISKNIEGLVTFRSFSARLNERNSDLTSKLIGHRSIIHRCLNHPFAPYLAIQSLNGRLSIWKHDFPHMLTAMDQQSFGAGMSHWTSLTDALTFSSFCWFPARSKIAILCLERNSSLVKLFEPSTSNVFPQNDDKWQCTQSFDLQLENVQTIKAVVVDLKSTVSRKQSDPSLVKKSSDPIGTRTLSQRVILLAQSPDRIRVVWLHQTNADLDSPYQATIVEDILNEWKGDFITFDVQASIPRKSAVGGGLKRGMDLVCSTSAGNLVHVHSQRVAADNVHDSSIQLIKHELERLGETVRISSINICSGNFFATSTGKVVTLWQLSSLDSFKYQKSYEVYPESSSNSLIYSVVTLGDGIVRLATTEVPPKEAKGSSDNIVISLHLPLRGSYGREAASKIRSSWRTIKIDLSRFLHRYHRYARGMSIKIIGLRFTPYGTLCVVLEDSLCYIPAHRLFLQDESTSILPVPFYHPALIMEMMVNGKIEGTKTLLKFLSQKLTKNLPFNAPFPQTSLESVLEKFSGNESFQPVINDFTESDSAKLEEYISENLLPFIGRRDNLQLLAVLNTLRDIETLSRSLDPFGVRFLVAFKHGSFLKKSIQKGAGSVSLSSVDFAWAFHSTVQDSLLDIVINDQFDLDYAAFLGLGYWLQNPRSIKVIIEKLAVKEYQKRKNPLDSVLFYAALDKVSVLLGLFKADRGKPESEFMGQFLSKDFSVKENRDLAMNYAFGFMRKQKYKAAASFMLIARNQDYAIRIIARNMGDYPLAIMFCRLFGRGSPSDPLFQEIVQDVILDHALKEKDLWLAHLAFWILDKKTDAVNCVMNYDPDSIIFRPDVAFFIAQLSNSAVARSKGFDRKFTTRETNSIAFEAAAEYLRFGWAFLALEQLFSIRDEENVNVVSISSLMTLSSNDDEDEKDYSDKLFVGFSLSQLQQDIIDLFIATRASLKPYQGPYERYHLKKLREKWENLMRLQAVEVISLKPKEKNPFGFTFDALDDSEDEEEPKVVDTAVNPSSTDLANDEELKNFVPTIARRSLLEEINLLANYFNFDIVRTTSSLKRFVRSHHMFLHYLDIQVEAGESKSLHGFINSEFQSLISLVTSSNFLELPFNRSRRLISSALILSKWQNDLKTWTQHPEAEPLPTAFEFSDNMTVKCLIWTSLCIALLSRKKFSILHRLLSSKENDYLSVVEQLSQDPEFSFSGSAWIEQYKYDYGDYEFLHERKFAEHEQEVEKVKEGLYTLLVIRRFMSRFRERYLFRHDEMLQTGKGSELLHSFSRSKLFNDNSALL